MVEQKQVRGIFFYALLLLNYLYMFSGVVFAFWIMKDHPVWSALLIAGAIAFFKGLVGLGKKLRKLDLVEKSIWADDKTGITFLNNQRKEYEKELGISTKSYVQNLIDEINKQDIPGVKKNGLVKKSKNSRKSGAKGRS